MKPKHYPIALLLGIFALSSAFYLNTLVAPAAAVDDTALLSDISADRYLKQVTYLAQDDMKGRGNGSPELERAADYIASQFRIWGLSPAGDNATFFQKFDLTVGSEFGAQNEAAINGSALKINQDFVPISFSKTADVTGPVVFAGYGITAP